MRIHTLAVGLALLTPATLTAQNAAVVTQASSTLATDLSTNAAAKVERIMLARCADGSVLGFSSRRVDTVANTTVTLKKHSSVAKLAAFPAADPLQQWLALELVNFALSNDALDPLVGREWDSVKAGATTIQIGRPKSVVSCAAEALLAGYPNEDALDGGSMIRQAGSAADPVAWAFISEPKKKNKKEVRACVVNVINPDGVAPLAGAPLASFYEALDPKKDAFRNGPLPAANLPADSAGYELRILNIGMVRLASALFIGFGKLTMDASQMSYVVVDRSNGAIVKRGRVQRAIGKDTLDHVRDLGRYISCR